MIWRIELTRTAELMFEKIQDRRVREKIGKRVDSHGQACGDHPASKASERGRLQPALPVEGVTQAPIIDGLANEPEKQGKPLTGDLAGYRSLRAIGQRYRIIYRVEQAKVLVLVVALGIRKEGSKADIYSLAKKLLRLGLLRP